MGPDREDILRRMAKKTEEDAADALVKGFLWGVVAMLILAAFACWVTV